MKIHWIGASRQGKGVQGVGVGTSLAVAQFMELVRGQRTRLEPQNRFQVALIVAEPRYCLSCYRVKVHDVIFGVGYEVAARCRFCGKESGKCLMGGVR
jgi:hypothetical protein